MIRMTLSFLGCALWLTGANAFAADPCRVAPFEPERVAKTVLGDLPDLGVAVLPANLKVGLVAEGRQALVRDHALVGQFAIDNEPRLGRSSFRVYDARGNLLFNVTERRDTCRAGSRQISGLCRIITTSTELQPATSSGVPAFTMAIGPDDFVLIDYLRYQSFVDFYVWRMAYADALNWLKSTLMATTDTVSIEETTLESRLFWQVASDPQLAPYADRLRFMTVQGRLHVTGTVPNNSIYDAILRKMAEAGHSEVVPDMTIDGRTTLPVDVDPVMLTCLRR